MTAPSVPTAAWLLAALLLAPVAAAGDSLAPPPPEGDLDEAADALLVAVTEARRHAERAVEDVDRFLREEAERLPDEAPPTDAVERTVGRAFASLVDTVAGAADEAERAPDAALRAAAGALRTANALAAEILALLSRVAEPLRGLIDQVEALRDRL